MRNWRVLHDYWFGKFENQDIDARVKLWFYKNPEVDSYIRESFVPWLGAMTVEEITSWKATPQGFVTLIVLHDQVPRNSFRGSPKSFAYDALALDLCLEGLDHIDVKLDVFEKLFYYLPLEHSEDLVMQEKAVQLYQKTLSESKDPNLVEFIRSNVDYAVRHRDIIRKFGRFPHRNEVLGRSSTPEEIEFLRQPGSSF